MIVDRFGAFGAGCDPYPPPPAGSDILNWPLPGGYCDAGGVINECSDAGTTPAECAWVMADPYRACTSWKLTAGQCYRLLAVCGACGGGGGAVTGSGGAVTGGTGYVPGAGGTGTLASIYNALPWWGWALIGLGVVGGSAFILTRD